MINARASKEKQELLHDLYRFIFADPLDCWAATAPFTLARKSGRRDPPTVRGFPDVDKIITATDNRIFLPRTLVFNELADAMHRAVQKVPLGQRGYQGILEKRRPKPIVRPPATKVEGKESFRRERSAW